MPHWECKSGAVYTYGRQKGRKKGHDTLKDVEACEYCTPGGPPAPAPNPTLTDPNPPKPAEAKPATAPGGGPAKATYAPGSAEVQPTRTAAKKAEEAQDYVVDGAHTLMFWNEVVFWWLGVASDALDKFVWKVPFHVDKSKLAISPFAATQLNTGNVSNMYTRLATRACKLFKLPDQKSAHLAIEDAAFLSKFGGVLAAFGSHYYRISKESPTLKGWRDKRALAKAEKERKAEAARQAKELVEVNRADGAAATG